LKISIESRLGEGEKLRKFLPTGYRNLNWIQGGWTWCCYKIRLGMSLLVEYLLWWF